MKKRSLGKSFAALALILFAFVFFSSLFIPGVLRGAQTGDQYGPGDHDGSGDTGADAASSPAGEPFWTYIPDPVISEEPEPQESMEPEPEEEPEQEPAMPLFEPYHVEGTAPDLMIASSAIMANGEIVSEFMFEERMDFGYGHDYAELEGILTFRGNNFRDTAAYGRADIKEEKFGDKWSYGTGSYTAPDGAFWSGNGWTGQPLIVKWPQRTRESMNMHDWAKEQGELIEVVYAAMDGYVYFTELETGKATRNRLYLGLPFKGSGALDPRGYPLLYVGAGYSGEKGGPRILVVSLVDGSVLHSFGNNDGFSQRSWDAADASALVDAETDTLIYPSENGVIYFIKLNSVFDPDAGTMTIEPSSPVKWRFKGHRSHAGGKYWLGMEGSAVIWCGHLIISDNGGHLVCLDINTLELVWVQDILDDANCTPVLELEDGHPYVYTSTSFHGDWRAPMNSSAVVPMWKIDAVTGEIVWQTDYECRTSSGVSGGVQASAALGKHSLSDLVFMPFARTPSGYSGILAAFDKQSGEVIWEFRTNEYAWSSPVCVYGPDGKGYVIYCTSGGYMYLLDGLTGEALDSVQLGGNIEASPAVYENTVVVGTRSQRTWGVTLK